MGFDLAQYRHRLRRELDLPHDYDDLADRLRDAFTDALTDLMDEEQGAEG